MERQIITVDIAPGNSQVERLGSSQGDIGRPMGVYIIQNGVALDCSAYSAELYILKPDGKFYTTQATVDATEKNLIKWETALQETPVAGACAAQIRITAGVDDIGTARFVEFVEASPGDMGAASESEVALLTEYVRQARESATSAGRDATTASGAASSASGSASTASAAASTATQAASAATDAANRAEEVEESIPADYSQLSADVSGLKSAFTQLDANVITESAGPAPIVSIADGADGMPMRKVEVAIEPVQDGEGDPSPENVRPISGWTGAKVTRAGKNLFNLGLVNTTTGRLTIDGTTISKRDSGYQVDVFSGGQGSASASLKVFMLKAGTYTISGIYVGPGNLSVRILADDATVQGETIASITANSPSGSFTLDKDSYITLRYTAQPACTVTNLQIEPGSTATAYESYQGQTYEVTFPSEAGTVYGGTLDVVSGKLVVDRAYTTLNGSESWAGEQLSDPLKTYYFIRLGAFGYLVDENIVCDKYRQVSITSQNEVIGINTLNSSARARAILLLRPNHNGMSVDEFKSWLSENPITCAYKITSTTVYQLTSTEIKTLLGENYLFADAGNTSVTYPADTKTYIDNRINSTRKLIAGIETGFVASKAYTVGDMLIIGDDLYKVASSIASGATITVGTNVTKTTVAEQLLALMNA